MIHKPAGLPDGWSTTTLESVLTGPRDLTYGIVQPGRHDPDGIPIIRVTDIRNGRVAVESPMRVAAAVAAPFERSRLQGGELLITLVGTVGECAVAPDYLRDWNTARAVGVARIKPEIGAEWVALCLRSPDVQQRISARVNTTVQTTLNLKDLRELPVVLPPVEELRRTAAFCTALEDKIESKRRAITLSRTLARALYVQACNGTTSSVAVADVVTFHNSRRVPLSSRQRQAMPGEVPYYGATGVFGYVAKALFDETLLLVGEDGSVVQQNGCPITQYVWGPAWVNNHAHVLTGNGISTEVALLALERADARPLITGAVQAKLSMGNLKRLRVAVPGGRRLQDLQQAVDPLFAVVRQSSDESRRLMALRDALLPELLSGRLRVPEAVEAVDQALA